MSGPQVQGLELRSNYFYQAADFAALAGLLSDVFDVNIAVQNRFGGPDPSCMPFGLFDGGGVCVANFSAFSMPLRIMDRDVNAVGFQSGAVRPVHRGKGLFRILMQLAFEWAVKQGFEMGVLLTDKPDLYRPYGFESVEEHDFIGVAPDGAPAPSRRKLDLSKEGDVQILSRLLVRRRPVSDVFSVRAQSQMFLLNAASNRDIELVYLPDLDAVVAWRPQCEAAVILDVVAGEIPDIGVLAAALGAAGKTVRTGFCPDLLSWTTNAPVAKAGGCALMMRVFSGSKPRISSFGLSPMAEF